MSNSIKSSESSGACSPSPCNLDGFVTYVIIIGSMCDVRLYTFTGVSVRIQVLSGQVCGRDCNPYPGKYYTGYHSIFVWFWALWNILKKPKTRQSRDVQKPPWHYNQNPCFGSSVSHPFIHQNPWWDGMVSGSSPTLN